MFDRFRILSMYVWYIEMCTLHFTVQTMMMFYFDRGRVLAMLVNIWYTTKSYVRYEIYPSHIPTLIGVLNQ